MKLQDILPKLKTNIESFFQDSKTKIYKINIYEEFESTILQILLENKDNSLISFDDLVTYNEKISDLLDREFADIDDDYMLEVSSAGAERKVDSLDTLKNSLEQYFFVQTKELEFNGTLIDVNNNVLTFKYFIKGQPKKAILEYEQIDFIRFAIKF
ncbi:ribosome assembly cofactor RimP [Spiroplasma endosymbiont of Crioceris asparagi]|uniref:ribosome assembly cofactor RimP n=1 Tax=Spiroplasma endosymbiont of Crioceris asparagi TaxID=3066286 RepID=UPI0030CE1F20